MIIFSVSDWVSFVLVSRICWLILWKSWNFFFRETETVLGEKKFGWKLETELFCWDKKLRISFQVKPFSGYLSLPLSHLLHLSLLAPSLSLSHSLSLSLSHSFSLSLSLSLSLLLSLSLSLSLSRSLLSYCSFHYLSISLFCPLCSFSLFFSSQNWDF